MLKNNFIPYIICLCLFTFYSCEKEIDVDLNSVDPQVVIEATIIKDSIAQVFVTKTKDYKSDNHFVSANGAIVTISDNRGNLEVLKQNSDGWYVSEKLVGVIGVTYHLSVKLDGKEYMAQSTMPTPVEIEELKMYFIQTFDYAFPMIVLNDPSSISNYYRYKLFFNGIRMKTENEAFDDKNRDGVQIEQILPVFDNEKKNDRKTEKGDTVMVELQSIDEGAYDFFDSLGNIGENQANPTSNITGGALGYFSAYSFERKQVIANW